MLEAGLSLIAASLPTLSYLVTPDSLRSALRSVRSKVAHHSIQSTGRSEDRIVFSGTEEGPYTEIKTNSSAASRTKMSASDDPDSHELNDFTQGIYVKREVAATDSLV